MFCKVNSFSIKLDFICATAEINGVSVKLVHTISCLYYKERQNDSYDIAMMPHAFNVRF